MKASHIFISFLALSISSPSDFLVNAGAAAVIGRQEEADSQVDEMKLIETLDALQLKLESPELDQRDAAEQELIRLGPIVLDYLEPKPESSSDAIARIARVRTELEKLEIARFTTASTVKLSGNYLLRDALEEISKQTGNRLSTDKVPVQILEAKMKLDFEETEFWTALNSIMNQANLRVDPYAGNVGELVLALNDKGMQELVGNVPGVSPVEVKVPRCSDGLFEMSVVRITSVRDLLRPASNGSQLTLLVRWEPRLQPISIDLAFDQIRAKTDQGVDLPLSRKEGVFHGSVSNDTPQLEIIIPLEQVDRSVKRIKTLDANLTAVVTGRQETFRFRKIGKLNAGAQQQKGGATVTFGGIARNDDLFGVEITLSFDQSFNALESYRAWAYDNPMYLEDDKGNRIEPVTIEGLRQSSEAVSIRYYFVDNPAEHHLVYKTVAAILKHEIKLKIEDIDFP